MTSLNKIILIGNLTSEPDIKETTNGQLLSRFNIAVDRPSQTGAIEKQTDYISVVAWREAAESTQSLTKGSKCLVEGKVITRTYDDDDGKRHYITEVESRLITLLSEKQAATPPSAPSTVNNDAALEESSDAVNFDFNIDDVPSTNKEPANSPVNLGTDIEENIPF